MTRFFKNKRVASCSKKWLPIAIATSIAATAVGGLAFCCVKLIKGKNKKTDDEDLFSLLDEEYEEEYVNEDEEAKTDLDE